MDYQIHHILPEGIQSGAELESRKCTNNQYIQTYMLVVSGSATQLNGICVMFSHTIYYIYYNIQVCHIEMYV